MNSAEKDLLVKIKSYLLIEEDVKKLSKRLKSSEYTLTPAYKSDGSGFSGFSKNSKVENLATKRLEIQRQLNEKIFWLRKIDDAIEKAGLTKKERDLIECTIKGWSLSSYARQKNIYKSHVYKIRDRALKKMVKWIDNTKCI
jgi:hypothetical protein